VQNKRVAWWFSAATSEFVPFFLGPVDPAGAYRQAVRRRDRSVHDRNDFDIAVRLRRTGARHFRGHGQIARPGVLDVGGIQIRCRDLVLATGSVPILPPIVGLQSITPWTARSVTEGAFSRVLDGPLLELARATKRHAATGR
jgi:dihydrolipoamide dehydrogenase